MKRSGGEWQIISRGVEFADLYYLAPRPSNNVHSYNVLLEGHACSYIKLDYKIFRFHIESFCVRILIIVAHPGVHCV